MKCFKIKGSPPPRTSLLDDLVLWLFPSACISTGRSMGTCDLLALCYGGGATLDPFAGLKPDCSDSVNVASLFGSELHPALLRTQRTNRRSYSGKRCFCLKLPRPSCSNAIYWPCLFQRLQRHWNIGSALMWPSQDPLSPSK